MLSSVAFAIATLLSAQGVTADPNLPALQNALTAYSTQPTLFIQLNGSISYRGKTTQLVTQLYWNSTTTGTTQTLQADLESYSNGVLIKRVVADGDTVWSYDMLLHQYSATPYGGTPGLVRPETYQVDLLNNLNLFATGNDGYIAKLLRQIYTIVTVNGLPTSNYTSWMPGIASYQLLQGQPVTDPINPSVTYTPSAGSDFYAYNASPKRTIVFEVAPATQVNSTSLPANGLENIYYNQVETVARNERLIQWVITPTAGFTWSTSLFAPYSGADLKGWRTIVAPKPVTH